MLRRPKKKFQKQKEDRTEYKNVSYRLPVNLINELNNHVDKNHSACKLVTGILRWALEDLRGERK